MRFFSLTLFWFSFFQSSIPFLSASICSNGAPPISHPFHLNHPQQQPLRSSYEVPPDGFELFCENNLTTVHFPSSSSHGGDYHLVVKSISYPTKRINLLDPRNCVHNVFLNLHLSLTPFHYFYVLKNYTYLNCSTTLSRPFMEIPCMSGSGFHVYTVEPSFPVPRSCVAVKTVAIPFEYSPYLSDNSLGLGFTWDSPPLFQETRTEHAVISMCVFVIVMVVLVSIKVQWSTRNSGEKEDQLLQSV